MISEGRCTGVLAEVFGPYEEKNPFPTGPPMKTKFEFIWQVAETIDNPDSDYHGQRITGTQWFDLYWGSQEKPSPMRRQLNAWRNKILTDEELRVLDISQLVGINATLVVDHELKANGSKKHVISLKPGPPKEEWLTVEDYTPKAERVKKKEAAEMTSDDEAPGAPEFTDDVPFAWPLILLPLIGGLVG